MDHKVATGEGKDEKGKMDSWDEREKDGKRLMARARMIQEWKKLKKGYN